jgi:hypothetical protein
MRRRILGRNKGRKKGSTNEVNKKETRKTVTAYHNPVA